MCQPGGSQRIFGACGCNCGCCGCGCGKFFRHFMSAEEEKARLEEYNDQLEKDLSGVNVRIRELTAA